MDVKETTSIWTRSIEADKALDDAKQRLHDAAINADAISAKPRTPAAMRDDAYRTLALCHERVRDAQALVNVLNAECDEENERIEASIRAMEEVAAVTAVEELLGFGATGRVEPEVETLDAAQAKKRSANEKRRATIWDKKDQPAHEEVYAAKRLTFWVEVETQSGEIGRATLVLKDGKLYFRNGCTVRGRLPQLERMHVDLTELPKWFTRQIGYQALSAEWMGPIWRERGCESNAKRW